MNFDAKRAGIIDVDLNSGMLNLSHFDLGCFSNALPVMINHHYESINHNTAKDIVILDKGKKEIYNKWCGKGWKTNLNQYLIKEKKDTLFDDFETAKKITYIDGCGHHIIFKEHYYYIKDENKIYVHPTEVTIDINNNLTVLIDNVVYDVYQESKYKNLMLSGIAEDFKDIEYIQVELDEIASLKEEIKTIEKNINDCNNSISYNESLLNVMRIKESINTYNSNIQELSLENESLDLAFQIDNIANQKTYDVKQNNYIEAINAKAQFNITELENEITDLSELILEVQNAIEDLKQSLENGDGDSYDLRQNINSYESQKEELIAKKANREAVKTLLETELTAKNEFDTIGRVITKSNQALLWGKFKDESGNEILLDGKTSGTLFNRSKIYEDSKSMKAISDCYNSENYTCQKNKIEYENESLKSQLCELNILLNKKQKQLQVIEDQLPTYVIYDENGNALGFSKTSDENVYRLTLIADNYNNAISINYKNDKIDTIVDKNDKTIIFKYNNDGMLEKITDFNSKYIKIC